MVRSTSAQHTTPQPVHNLCMTGRGGMEGNCERIKEREEEGGETTSSNGYGAEGVG